MKRKFKQLSYEERVKIDLLKNEGKSLRYIAGVLGRSPNTVSRELREREVKGKYVPKKAQHKAYWKRYMSKKDCMKVAMDKELSRLVPEKLKAGWSPERIAGYLNKDGQKISTKAVYKFVYSRRLDYLLFWERNKQKPGRKKYQKSIQTERNFIEKRPLCLSSGHLEADFIVSSFSAWCLFVAVDRHTRYVWILKMPNRKSATVLRALKRITGYIDLKTITVDNDLAFAGWKEMEKTLRTKIYFCHPYHSWEKGLIENTNRWIRCFIPKKRDIQTVTEEELREAQTFLNTVPRKIIGFRTARELLLESNGCPN